MKTPVGSSKIGDGTYALPAATVSLPASWTAPLTHTTPSPYLSSSNFRGMLGASYAGASSTDPQTKLLADITADIPFNNLHFGVWGFARLGSISQSTGNITQPSQVAAAYSSLSSAQPSQIVQSFEMKAGVAFQFKPRPFPIDIYKSYVISLIAGAGTLTPASPGQTQISSQTYVVDSGVFTYFTTDKQYAAQYATAFQTACSTTNPVVTPPTNCLVAVYSQDRSRFFRSYDAGFRLKLYPRQTSNNAELFPAMFDFTVGQNEYVTGGMLRHMVIHAGFSVPVIAGSYLFASMDTSAQANGNTYQPLLLQASAAQIASSTYKTVSVQAPQPNRDRYMIGFGIDLLYLIRNHLFQDAAK